MSIGFLSMPISTLDRLDRLRVGALLPHQPAGAQDQRPGHRRRSDPLARQVTEVLEGRVRRQ
jgi:hypothetical protein